MIKVYYEYTVCIKYLNITNYFSWLINDNQGDNRRRRIILVQYMFAIRHLLRGLYRMRNVIFRNHKHVWANEIDFRKYLKLRLIITKNKIWTVSRKSDRKIIKSSSLFSYCSGPQALDSIHPPLAGQTPCFTLFTHSNGNLFGKHFIISLGTDAMYPIMASNIVIKSIKHW